MLGVFNDDPVDYYVFRMGYFDTSLWLVDDAPANDSHVFNFIANELSPNHSPTVNVYRFIAGDFEHIAWLVIWRVNSGPK